MQSVKIMHRHQQPRELPGKGRSSFTFWDYVFAEGRGRDALLYAKLYAPDFVDVDGLVLIADVVADNEDRMRVRAALAHYGDTQEVERQFNLVEIDSLLPHGDESDDAAERLLASVLIDVWSAVLARRFPDRRFVVRMVEPDQEGGSLGVVFHQR